MICRALTECVHGLLSLSVNTVNMQVLSRTISPSVFRLLSYHSENHHRMISKDKLESRETYVYEQNDLVLPASSYHSQFTKLGCKPNPTGL